MVTNPTWGLISTARAHAPPGHYDADRTYPWSAPWRATPRDLDLALRALAGPGPVAGGPAWRVALPPPRHRRLRRVFASAVWASSPLCRIDSSVL